MCHDPARVLRKVWYTFALEELHVMLSLSALSRKSPTDLQRVLCALWDLVRRMLFESVASQDRSAAERGRELLSPGEG